jgi:hypothetical protein
MSVPTAIILSGVIGCGLCGCVFLAIGLRAIWREIRAGNPRLTGIILGAATGLLATILTLLCASSLHAAAPASAEPVNLVAALNRASAAWGRLSPDPVTVRFARMNDCDLSRGRHPQIAGTEVVSTRIGDADPEYSYVITINSACHWTQRWLDDAMAHEYGHVLAGPAHLTEHSRDAHSIMWPNVDERGGQRITDADRKMRVAD